MVMALLRRGVGRVLNSQPKNTRSMADVYVPKPDTSMDHVFGDNSVRLPHNFEPPSMGKTFTLTVATLGIFFLPVWVMAYSDYQMADFQNRLQEARAKKAASTAAADSS
uniref:Uncharacterized protein n=1 Tax=Dunaliella tertiolecta TaxID=3047 RepID=A0A7S3R9X0_DUNTE|mmetsp:Transcript_29086/g.78362  ORF Transcript_29086/g.78362 Transcript_29086/m.78362 type:complete len:109 (-) Transcript_29086:1007-1333(-)|eukprot:CAMPEP_0202349950 /NCGR_PEP_ID=MMETSP1126-20121109/7224_1 /ASSEMBLY_ACC=CAM_ASM_000457 /TAXON_ID=3047 /ORGANISM="Dunaliella tertiolecta, Strain CCMP1320" /LENGTH=108 /DNA_ID=CAMNT_0048941837 /DNA_START=35 /DNA_END=361 /DNA_ORIENTATION=+